MTNGSTATKPSICLLTSEGSIWGNGSSIHLTFDESPPLLSIQCMPATWMMLRRVLDAQVFPSRSLADRIGESTATWKPKTSLVPRLLMAPLAMKRKSNPWRWPW